MFRNDDNSSSLFSQNCVYSAKASTFLLLKCVCVYVCAYPDQKKIRTIRSENVLRNVNAIETRIFYTVVVCIKEKNQEEPGIQTIDSHLSHANVGLYFVHLENGANWKCWIFFKWKRPEEPNKHWDYILDEKLLYFEWMNECKTHKKNKIILQWYFIRKINFN